MVRSMYLKNTTSANNFSTQNKKVMENQLEESNEEKFAELRFEKSASQESSCHKNEFSYRSSEE